MARGKGSRALSVEMFKIVDLKDGEPITLFHGYDGERKLPFGKWIRADLKTVSDGSKGTPYLSGFHVLMSVESCRRYLDRFKNMAPKAIVRCDAMSVWPKWHSRDPVYLAKYIRVKEIVWKAEKTS